MTGDKVGVKVEIVENDGTFSVVKEIAQKPQFMMEDDYKLQLIKCATNAVQIVCEACYPDNREGKEMLAKAIAKKAMEEQDG